MIQGSDCPNNFSFFSSSYCIWKSPMYGKWIFTYQIAIGCAHGIVMPAQFRRGGEVYTADRDLKLPRDLRPVSPSVRIRICIIWQVAYG